MPEKPQPSRSNAYLAKIKRIWYNVYMPYTKHKCPQCKKIFFNYDRRYKFCSHSCSYLSRMKNPIDRLGFGRNGYKQGKTIENPHWKGNNAQKRSIHDWISRNFGQEPKCEMCGKEQTIEWSNIDHLYSRNRQDWQRLCRSCHMKYDYQQGLRIKG